MSANPKYLAGKHHAQHIASGCDVAFFVSNHSAIAAAWHWKGVHEHFAKLAEELGYRIEKIEAVEEERTCQTTGIKYAAKIEQPFTTEQLGAA